MEWWEFVIILAIFFPIMVLWLGCIIDAIGRPDLSGWMKAAWIVFILFVPLIGSLVYVITRPRVIVSRETDMDVAWSGSPDAFPTSHSRAPQ
jgi:hypothetical protein